MGVGATFLGAWLAGPDGRNLPYVVVLVLAIGIVGLLLGGAAALSAYVAGAAALIAIVLVLPGGVQSLEPSAWDSRAPGSALARESPGSSAATSRS